MCSGQWDEEEDLTLKTSFVLLSDAFSFPPQLAEFEDTLEDCEGLTWKEPNIGRLIEAYLHQPVLCFLFIMFSCYFLFLCNMS